MTEESLSGDANGLSETAKPYIFRRERALVVSHWLRKHGRSAFPALRCGLCVSVHTWRIAIKLRGTEDSKLQTGVQQGTADLNAKKHRGKSLCVLIVEFIII